MMHFRATYNVTVAGIFKVQMAQGTSQIAPHYTRLQTGSILTAKWLNP